MITDAWIIWLLLLVILHTISTGVCEVGSLKVNATLVDLRIVLDMQGVLPGGILSLMLADAPNRIMLSRDVVEWTGRGSALLPAPYWETAWPFGIDDFISMGDFTQEKFADPDAPYTVLDWRYLVNTHLELQPGQSLTVKSMIWYAATILYSVPKMLSDLSFRAIMVPRNSTLWLEDVVIMLMCDDARALLQSLCSSLDDWPFNPEFLVEDGVLHIRNLTSWAPWEGSRGAGGQIQWRNVDLTCPGQPGGGIPTPRPCVGRAVNTSLELLTASRKALLEENATWVILSVTSDIALLPEGGRLTPVPLDPGKHLILRGDPARRTTLDLSGLADVWSLPGNRVMDTLHLAGAPMALLYDLTLVNLPVYPTWPNGAMSLLAASLPCFGLSRGTLWDGVEQIAVKRSAIVVPEMELHFLARIGDAQNFSDVWPGQPAGSFFVSLSEQPNGSAASTGLLNQLHVEELKLMSEVHLTDCLLVSTRSYREWPTAVPLMTESPIWLLEQVAAGDPATVNRWGYGGLMVASGLQHALMDLAFCDSRPEYHPIRIILRHHDTTVPPLSSEPLAPINLSIAGALEAAEDCAVDGSPSKIGGGRVFSDLQGAVSRFSLVRPITLRNLVLYNLAPGGMVPANLSVMGGNTTLSPSPQAVPIAYAAWENSSLPLWFFHCARTDEDLVYQPTAAELPRNSTSTPLQLSLRLVLENVTLVVPEREWRAMVAAVLLIHASDAMHAAQQSGRRRQLDFVNATLGDRSQSLSTTPPSPPDNEYTYEALLSFAAQCEGLSYNYSAGELVLAIARHYGWSGTNVTITYKLPADAPENATLLSYQDLILPYDQLAGMNIDFQVNFITRPLGKTMGPLLKDSLSPTATDGTPISNHSKTVTSARRHNSAWLVPVVASLSVALGVALFIIAAVVIRGRIMKAGQRSNDSGGGCCNYSVCKMSVSTTGSQRSGSNLDSAPDMQTATLEGPSVVEVFCKSTSKTADGAAFDVAASQRQETRPGTLPSLRSGQQLTDSDTPGAMSSDESNVTKANRAALMHAFAKNLQPGSAPTVLGTKRGSDRGNGGGADNGSVVSMLGHVDTQDFLKELHAYYRAVMASDSDLSSPKILTDAEGAKLVQYGAVVKRNGPRKISDAIKTLQATLKDNELYLEHIIGSGAFGAVYRGMWCGLPVAVKTLVVANDLEGKAGRARKQAALEAAISLAMAHPNVVVTYSYDVEPLVHAPPKVVQSATTEAVETFGRVAGIESCDALKLHIVQEYCNGGTLRRALDRGMAGCARVVGRPGDLARLLALHVALGMQHIHSLRIVHGDLKPENVLFMLAPRVETEEGLGPCQSAAGGRLGPNSSRSVLSSGSLFASCFSLLKDLQLTAKVADFGLSAPLAEGATHASRHFVGTPAYLAPEVASDGKLSPRSDVWSFGIILIELFFGCSLDVVHRVYTATRGATPVGGQVGNGGKLLWPSYAFLQDVLLTMADRSYAELVGRCLSLDPRDRPNFDELVNALESR
ncbi:hypothetical protein Vretifemale_4336 [Volvox reticuliferus]|uniref:Protein kinase domain-containing protein n=1 Tax=Volvox reticuliferus TaxID=1737510 RepID=A0A8J4C6K7_9CHLO|nr:hypothetical protein Vretifemale_4336 [Volvox reticuliferus]